MVIGVREGGIYKVPKKYIKYMVHHFIIPCNLWHRILGHLHYKPIPGLQQMVKGMPIFDFEHNSVCRGCALRKNVKIVFFSSSSTRSKGILDLVHYDICGPMSSLL